MTINEHQYPLTGNLRIYGNNGPQITTTTTKTHGEANKIFCVTKTL